MTRADFRVFAKEKDGEFQDMGENDPVVVNQFSDWYLKPTKASIEEIFIHWGEEYIQLDRNDKHTAYRWPRGTRRTRDQLKKTKRSGGSLYFYRRRADGKYIKLEPSLFVLAESLREHEYPALLDRLGQLAVSSQGAIAAPIAGPLPAGLKSHADLKGVNSWLHAPNVRRAEALLRFSEVCRTQLPIILRSPSTTSKRSYLRSRIDSSKAQRTPLATQQITRRPGFTHVNIQVLEKSVDTPENQFVVLALRRLKSDANGTRTALLRHAKELLDPKQEPPPSEVDAMRLWKQGRHSAKEASDYFENLAKHLEEAEDWATMTLANPLFRTLQPSFPRYPSLKLTRSPGYGPIYNTFRTIFSNDSIEFKIDALQQGLLERTVRPTSELYEIWVFFEVYALLVEQFGFEPANGGPAAHLLLQNGELQLEKEHWFELELKLQDEPSEVYRIRLAHEPKIPFPPCEEGKRCFLPEVCPSLPCNPLNSQKSDPRTPDVVMETFYRGESKRFVIDAKYRRYDIQRPYPDEEKRYQIKTAFDADVLGTAKQKYLDGLDLDAAFIVHSDPGEQYTYCGERRFGTPPHREAEAGLPLYAKHRYGAIFAAPYELANLEKLLKCLLMYHAEWYDICWTCRKRLQPKPGTGIAGKYYQCDQGHDFWVKSNCSGSEKHPLIKMGINSFHLTKPGQEWNCVCPVCGDELKSNYSSSPPPSEPPPWLYQRDTLIVL